MWKKFFSDGSFFLGQESRRTEDVSVLHPLLFRNVLLLDIETEKKENVKKQFFFVQINTKITSLKSVLTSLFVLSFQTRATGLSSSQVMQKTSSS